MKMFHSIQARLILAFSAIASLVAAGITGLAMMQMSEQAAQAQQVTVARVTAATTASLNTELLRLQSLGLSLAADARLIEAVRRTDRAGMGAVLDPVYRNLLAERQISTFGVATPPGLLHYRAHSEMTAPEDIAQRRGDVMAALAGRMAQGVIVAAQGLAFASTVPVMSEGRPIGAIFGQSLASDEFLQRIKASVNADLLVHVEREGRMARIGGTVREGQLAPDVLRQGLAGPTPPVSLAVGDRQLAVFALPLLDHAGRPVAVAELMLDTTAAAAAARAAMWKLLGFSFAALLVTLLLALWIARGMARPIGAMTGAMGELAQGRLETEVPAQGRRDEIGAMSAAVQVFKENAQAVRRLEQEQAAQAAAAEAEKRAAMHRMAETFEASIGGVVDNVASASVEMEASAQSLTRIAERTTGQAAAVRGATEEAAANVQTVAAASEELAATVGEIARQVSASNDIARRAVEQAEDTNGRVQGLNSAAQEIGEVVRLINDIAARTNLLALNATIEAARAGDAGKGFAVVASEVKALAAQTAKATEEIGAKVQEMQAATAASVTAIHAIGQTIGEMNHIASGIASAVDQQGAATREIARSVQSVAAGTQEVVGNIAGVNEAADETGAAAGQMLAAAGGLSREADQLKREVTGFVARIRAA
ncbi:HAMP domain-containing protein [Roseococcus sp. SDR]|uniref:methyl-accepting chemotaxis protein n=1 Tax=Roseococcus sp. SDR TaxID=2835532 RepID=UPI001BCB6163|nr:methyl-accepting chemotaxis protein [Roseococcus sp. SDR]MBS7789150.1 HAMP domain-containing protein [Roseococcus sp. SDR]MBV1844464.1 HAMP domain-containing protein [Roseococcus sp. SDR]